MSENIDGLWHPLVNPNNLQTTNHMWPVEVWLRAADLAGLLDVEFIANGADKSAIATTKIIYEDGPIANETRGSIHISVSESWVAITPAYFFQLICDVGQNQANWSETDANLAGYIRNKPADITVAEWRAKQTGRNLVSGPVWSAMAEVELDIDTGEIDLDFATGFDFTITMDANAQLMNPQNKTAGQRGIIRVVQDGSGSRLMTFDTDYQFINKTAITLSTSANADDEISYRVLSNGKIRLAIDKNWGV